MKKPFVARLLRRASGWRSLHLSHEDVCRMSDISRWEHYTNGSFSRLRHSWS